MSGHSHWAQIKHKKGAADEKKAKIFSKLLAAVAVAARENPDPQFNPRLRTAIETARAAQVPAENINRALARSRETEALEEISVEAYGPEGSAIIIEGITDNVNRTIMDIKQILAAHDAKIADPGGARWVFEKMKNEWKAKFPIVISSAGTEAVKKLVTTLENQNEIQRVITNVSQ